MASAPSSKLNTSTETNPLYPTSFNAAAIGLKFTFPNPGPFRFGSLAWKCAKCGQDSRMICGMDFDSELIALTSRMILKFGDGNCRTRSKASAAVLIKLVSAGPRGSKQIVTSRALAWTTASPKVSIVQSHACSGETPGSMLRCLGEP